MRIYDFVREHVIPFNSVIAMAITVAAVLDFLAPQAPYLAWLSYVLAAMVLLAMVLGGVTWWRARKNNYPRLPKATWGERWVAFRKSFWGLFLIVVVMGGIYSGIFTPTEAAAMSAVYAFIVAVFVYKDMGLKDVSRVLLSSANMSAMLLYIITNAALFSFIMTNENIPQSLADWMLGNGLGPIAFLLIYNVPGFALRVWGAVKGYELGVGFLDEAQRTGLMQKIMTCVGIVGVMVVGAMCKDMFWASIPVAIGSGEDAQTLQDILDGIMPGMLGMIAFWLYYWLLSKKINPMVLIVATMVVGIIGAFFGVLA